ncbi:MAG: GlyGly-CTERM sorting domain-containing protein [Pseudomonadales bacterium]|nr:GlyGly-CTERM sorting domain-containing protein [Pseudomonadales bacterium]
MIIRFCLPLFVSICVLLNPASAESIASGELLVRSGVAVEIHEFELQQPQTLSLSFGKLSSALSSSADVVGKLLIVSGPQHPFEIELDTRDGNSVVQNDVVLAAGKYSLVGYLDFVDSEEDGASVPVFIEMTTSAEQVLYSKAFTLATVSPENGNIVELADTIALSMDQTVTLHVSDEGVAGSNVYQPFTYAALVITKDGIPVVTKFYLGGSHYEETIDLDAGVYLVQWNIAGANSGLSALELLMLGDDETLQEERVVINDTDNTYGEVFDTFYLAPQPDGYEVKLATFLGTNIDDCDVELVNASGVLSVDIGTVNADLSGDYQLRIRCSDSKTTAVGIRIIDALEEEVFYSNVITLGDAQLVDSFQLEQAEIINIRTSDIGFLNAFRDVSILVTDGAAQNFLFDYAQSATVEGISNQLSGGKPYFLVVIPESSVADGNGVLRLVTRTANGSVISNKKIFHGVDNGLFLEGLELTGGRYTMTVQDHGFPIASRVLGLALFKGNTRVKSIQFGSNPGSLNGGTTDAVMLEQGSYDALVIMGSDEGGALVGYSIDRVGTGPNDPDSDRETGGSGSGSGGGGGSLSVFSLLAMLLLFVRRRN